MLDEATLKLLSRKEIQKLAKANGIKANLKTTDIIESLVELSRTAMMNGSFVGVTRSVKLELMDPESPLFSEPAAPNEDEDFGESISAGLQALRVIDRERSLQQVDGCEYAAVLRGDMETRGDGGYSPTAARASAAEVDRVDDLAPSDGDSIGKPTSTLPSIDRTGVSASQPAQPAHEPQVLDSPEVSPNPTRAIANIATPESIDMNTGLGSLGTPAEPSAKTLPANEQRSTSVDSINPSARSTREGREMEGSSQLGSSSDLVASPVGPSPSAHFYHRRATTLQGTPSPKPPRRFIPSSPLPPSSPPQDTSPSPPRHIVDEDEPLPLVQDSSPCRINNKDSSDDRHVVESISSRLSNGRNPNSAHSSPAEHGTPRPLQGVLLREPDSGDSAYSNSDNFYRSPPSDDSVNPAQMCEETYQDFIRCTKSLSEEIRRQLEFSVGVVHAVHSAERDAILNHRKACQEKHNFWRMHLWAAGFTNPAKKWNRQAIWKGPIDLILVDGEYVEVSSDDSRLEAEVPSSNFSWSTDGEPTNDARAHSDEDQPIIDQSAQETLDKEGETPPRKTSPVTWYSTIMDSSKIKYRSSSEESSSFSISRPYRRSVSEPKRSPELMYSPISDSPEAEQPPAGKKRTRDESEDELENEHYEARKVLHQEASSPRSLDQSPASDSSPSPIIPPYFFKSREDQSSAASDKEDYVDEKSVESILEELPSHSEDEDSDTSIQEAKTGAQDIFEGDDVDLVEVIDEAGERHRRFSAASKGKGRALA